MYRGELVISGVNYHPAPPTRAERDAGFLDSDLFEWIDVKNVSPQPVDLTGLRFTKGVESVAGAAGQFLTITFTRRADAADQLFTPQFGINLNSWTAATIRLSAEQNADGTVTETWRSDTPVSSTPRLFARIKVE